MELVKIKEDIEELNKAVKGLQSSVQELNGSVSDLLGAWKISKGVFFVFKLLTSIGASIIAIYTFIQTFGTKGHS